MSPYENQSLSTKIANHLVNHPIRAFLSAILVVVVLIPGLRYMKANFSYRIWFRESDPRLVQFDAFERQFGNDENVVVVLHHPGGIFNPETAGLLRDLTSDMWKIPEVIRVDSLSNYNWTHASGDMLEVEPLIPDEDPLDPGVLNKRRDIALNHEVLPGYLISKDGQTALISASLKPALNGTPDFETVVTRTRELVNKYIQNYKDKGPYEMYVTGSSAVSHTFKEVTQQDLKVMVPILMGAIVLFLLISFRRLSGVLLPLMIIGTSIVAALGFAGWSGIHFNNLTAVVPHILIAISVADAVHILVTFFQFRSSGMNRKQAAKTAIAKNLQPTLLTSVSTAIGFFSFATAEIVPIVYMGILAGVGTLIAWIITIFALAPLMVLLPIRVKKRAKKDELEKSHPFAIRYSQWIDRNKGKMFVAFGVLTVLAFAIALKNEINSNPFKYFSESVPVRIANEFAEDHVGGTMGFEIVIDSGQKDGIKSPAFLEKVESFENWVSDLNYISKTVSIVGILKQVNRSLNGDDQAFYRLPDSQDLIAQELFLYSMSLPQGMDLTNRMTLGYDKLRLTAMSRLHDSKETLEAIHRIEGKASSMGLKAIVTGKMPLYQKMNPLVVKAFISSITLALILVAALMMISLKSFKLGLLSMIPNLVPLVFGGALMTLLGKPLDIGTVLVTSTCLGIAVDDTIHFMANFNRWKEAGLSNVEAIAQVFTHTGPALLVTTMVLVAAFSTFAFASFIPNVNFGIMTASVLSTALIADSTLLPALLLMSTKNKAWNLSDELKKAA